MPMLHVVVEVLLLLLLLLLLFEKLGCWKAGGADVSGCC
jgi:hypothetical protein